MNQSQAASPAQPLRILIVDDHPLVRRGICEVIDEEEDMRVVAEAADGEQAVECARHLRPHGLDLVLMDIDMPRLDGISAAKRILAENPGLPVVMLTVSTLDRDLFEATRAGAIGYLSKSLTPTAMVRALRDFHREGALPMSPAMATRVLLHLQQTASAPPSEAPPEVPPQAPPHHAREEWTRSVLTPREREVLELIAQGARDKDIADRLVLSESTVRKHVQNILRRLDVRNRTEAITRFRDSTL